MRKFGSSNVVFNKLKNQEFAYEGERASYKGVGYKLLYFAVMTLLGAGLGIGLLAYNQNALAVIIAVSGILTFVLSLISMTSNRACKVTGALYCLFEGCLIGVLSFALKAVVEGVVTMALLSTIAVFAVCALLYVFNIVKVTAKFTRFLLMFSLGFIFSQLIFWLVSLFTPITYSFGMTMLVSLISVFLATLYLFFDMENIKYVVESGCPKEYEWTASFGLAFTLIWLYVEILRLIILLVGRDN